MGCFQFLLVPLFLAFLFMRACSLFFAPSPVEIDSPADCAGAWHMQCHDALAEPGYRKGKSLVLHEDGRVECHGLLRRDLCWVYRDGEPEIPVPEQGTWQLLPAGSSREQQLELRFPDGFGTHGQFYRKDGYREGALELWFWVDDPDCLQWARYVRPAELWAE